ncbi:MAG: DNA polymerase III subunit alpha [Bacteroidota bacterium]
MPSFSHLHCHTQYSLLDGQASVKSLMAKAAADNMRAVAITDHGNMFGVFNFVKEAAAHKIKPIIGCEFYLTEDRHIKQFTKENKDNRFHQLLLAKNQEGYKNLCTLTSLGYIEGLYSKWPRIDKELILKYHEGLIATTCCLGASVPQAILNQGEEAAEKEFKWWLDIFGEDYYIELQRHGLKEQEQVNHVLLKFAAKYNVKIICSNDSHYVDRDDANAHDILLCVNTGELKSTPIWKEEGSVPRDHRFGFSNDEFFFKTQAEMATLFHDLPQALDNTNEIVDKIDPPVIKRNIMLPEFPLPHGFTTPDDFLRHLTYEGGKKRYGDITDTVKERLDFELHTIKTMGFAGYFLIVQDLIARGRERGVWVGPGRGSAAGSAVAYAIGITNIDPIKYSLLFERFLNPERVTMPDIDIDFDDESRGKVIDYVVEKYGRNQVAQIITYGTMGAKSAIKDVARVLDLPLSEANYLAKLIPDGVGINLTQAYKDSPELAEIRSIPGPRQDVLRNAEKLEGSVRNTGIHASAYVIAPENLRTLVPLCVSKDAELYVSQFDGKLIEDAGLLKMDFLGLKTLTVMRDAIANIVMRGGDNIDLDFIPLDDEPTFNLYRRGDTVGTFQFESEGMRQYLKDLKPTNIEDLIAMNALFRPGPMNFIPSFINRKQGREKIAYPHPLLEGILKHTYGIMVYQEQIMQTAQILAGYSLGGADLLRRAMGKKDKEKMAKERVKFVEGSFKLHDIPEAHATEVFDIMERFAEYGFNRSHAAAYSVVAYQTAYLKANFPAEYMAAVLTNSMGDLDKITVMLNECRRMGLTVLGPDVNESMRTFSVNPEGKIRFGLGAIKGTGDAAAESIINERKQKGIFANVFDFAGRINIRAVNKKTLESLALSGAFDSFTYHRAQYFAEGDALVDKISKFANAVAVQKETAQSSLFGSSGTGSSAGALPKVNPCEPWSEIQKLRKEKEVVGFYISGHPLDQYRLELNKFCNSSLDTLDKFGPNQEVRVAGMISSKSVRQSKNGNPFMNFKLEDDMTALDIALFGKDYYSFKDYIEDGSMLRISGTMMPSFRDKEKLEFKISKVELLSELREKLKSIMLSINLENLTPFMIERLQEVAQKHPGKCYMRFQLYDSEKKTFVKVSSLGFRINPSNEFLDEIATVGSDAYELA